MRIWNQTRYENEIRIIVKDYWEPVDEIYKQGVRFVDGYNTLAGFENAVIEGCGNMAGTAKYYGVFNEEKFKDAMYYLCQIITFIDNYKDELSEHEGSMTFKECTMVIDEDWD
jgi:hypothetical protein